MVRLDYQELVFADIPGLVEGAHMGIGLGHDFLRHVQRTRLLVHVIDPTRDNPIADFHQINTELMLFDERLKDRPQIIAVNKMDLPDAQVGWELWEAEFNALGHPILTISAATQKNTRQLLGKVFELYSQLPAPAPVVTVEEAPIYQLEEDEHFEIEKLSTDVYQVHGKRIERIVSMTYFGYDDAARRFQDILEVMGISQALTDAGVQVGDTVIIGETTLEWGEG
ncbi:MAG: Obg family GTPase CgtA [Anaerolineae bacterium]|nr:Obg family GTPase CgtA [Anaerolineae bacterium]